jgi:uncharacterized membrane protein
MLPADAPKRGHCAVNGKVLLRVMLVLTVIGLADATYLTVVHYADIKVLCTGKGDPCQTVQSSKYSFLAGVPVALIGAIGYVLILGSLLLRDREETRLATLTLTLFGFGFSAYLTYRESFTITGHPIYCEWCVGSAIILTILLILSVLRYLRSPLPGHPPPTREADEPAAEPLLAAASKPKPRTPQRRQQLPRGQRRGR